MKIKCWWITVNPGYDNSPSFYTTTEDGKYWDDIYYYGKIASFVAELKEHGYTVLSVEDSDDYDAFGGCEYIVEIEEPDAAT